MPHLTPIRRCLPWPGCARAGVGSSGHVGPSPGWFLCSAELLLLRAEGHWKFINLGRRDLAGRRIRAGSPGPGLPSQAGAVGPGALCEAWTCPWAGGAREAPPTHQRAASWKSRPRQRLKGGREASGCLRFFLNFCSQEVSLPGLRAALPLDQLAPLTTHPR